MSSTRLASLDKIVEEAVARKDFPGAVLVVAHKGRTVYRKAFGVSQLVPEPRPLTPDMIFDLASVTKPVATATSIMLLVERGDIRLWDRVQLYVPEFTTWYGEKGIAGEEARLYNLLTHTSGLPPYTDAKEAAKKIGDPCTTADLVKLIAEIPKELPVGKEFVYSCLNYITLAHIVHKVSGKPLDEFAAENIFKPLGMTRTFYRPPADLIDQCVPTEVVDGSRSAASSTIRWPVFRAASPATPGCSRRPTTWPSSPRCCSAGANMNGVRILSPLTVERMTEIYPQVGGSGRGLGWDIDTDYATVRGDLFGLRSYGHSGYTGTSIWIDPETQTAVVLLTNRVHPDDKGDIIALRSKVANVVGGGDPVQIKPLTPARPHVIVRPGLSGMQVQIEREIYIRASRSHAVLSEAIQTFKGYLEQHVASSAPEYYRARNLLKEGKAFYDQTIQDAKKLLGPIPIYAAKDFEGWRVPDPPREQDRRPGPDARGAAQRARERRSPQDHHDPGGHRSPTFWPTSRPRNRARGSWPTSRSAWPSTGWPASSPRVRSSRRRPSANSRACLSEPGHFFASAFSRQ